MHDGSLKPARYYYSTLFSHDYGIEAYGECTKVAQEFVPRIKTSANFSPGSAGQGNAFMWIRIFREKAMGYLWTEDWAWENSGDDSPGRLSHFDTTLFISLAILYTKYTGRMSE